MMLSPEQSEWQDRNALSPDVPERTVLIYLWDGGASYINGHASESAFEEGLNSLRDHYGRVADQIEASSYQPYLEGE